MTVKLNRVHVIVDRPVIARLMCVMIEIGHTIAPTLTKAKKLYDDTLGTPSVTVNGANNVELAEKVGSSTSVQASPKDVSTQSVSHAGSTTLQVVASDGTLASPTNSGTLAPKAKMLRSSSGGGLSAMYALDL